MAMPSCKFMTEWFAPNSIVRKWNKSIDYRNTSKNINLNNELKVIGKRNRYNSQGAEFWPIISRDGKTLYFAQGRNHIKLCNEIVKSNINENGERGATEVLYLRKNHKYHYLNYISEDNDTAIFSYLVYAPPERIGGHYYSDFFITQKSFNVWSKPTRLFGMMLSDFGVATLTARFSNDLKYFIYTTNSYKGFGGTDIFVRIRKKNGFYSKPINLGKTVNTKGIEYGAFLAPDNETLYFSSSGHPGYGGADIYMTKRLDDSWERWTQPINLGPIINSEKSETDFILSNDKSKGFVVVDNDSGLTNIYFVKLDQSQ